MPQRFAEWVRRTPHATAVVGDGVEVTYAELDERADRLAGRLAAHGVTIEAPVALLMDRGPALVVAELAVLKAGGAYVPLDLRAPATRLRQLLAETGARVLLTDAAWATIAADVHTGAVLRADEDAPGPSFVPAPVFPDNLAYVIHTSGSTGRRRVWRCATATSVVRRRPALPGRRSRRAPAHSPHSFDAATYELWVPCSTVAGSCWPRRETWTPSWSNA